MPDPSVGCLTQASIPGTEQDRCRAVIAWELHGRAKVTQPRLNKAARARGQAAAVTLACIWTLAAIIPAAFLRAHLLKGAEEQVLANQIRRPGTRRQVMQRSRRRGRLGLHEEPNTECMAFMSSMYPASASFLNRNVPVTKDVL
ncbi:hypothetical protein NDU88_001093 [Pleurodeles waltl]|uniref:Uncharacterized protein n=1 Tax=Pleurodeles waltl TaxID=8319 RepID=A0AAV7NE53_PLEWA|nr:hypothetical protein NDU88_001093 [Pleurodeles waltl]